MIETTSPSLADLLSLAGRTAVVTGGASGIGFATARRFAEAGARVVIVGRDEDAGRRAAERLAPVPNGAHAFVRLDLADLEAVSQVVPAIAERHGGIHIWANIAGIYPLQDTFALTPDDWRRVIDVNLSGPFFASREAARQMRDQGTGGVILNTHSTGTQNTPPGGMAAYVASKGGVEALTRALAHEFGPAGIRVLAVNPTMTETEGMERQKEDLAKLGGADAAARYAARLPLRRVAQPDDVARVFLFAASDLALVMTGSVLAADAGDLVL